MFLPKIILFSGFFFAFNCLNETNPTGLEQLFNYKSNNISNLTWDLVNVTTALTTNLTILPIAKDGQNESVVGNITTNTPLSITNFSAQVANYEEKTEEGLTTNPLPTEVTTKKFATDEVSTKGLPTENISTKGLPIEVVSTNGFSTENVSTKGLPTEEVSTKGLPTEEVSTKGLPTEEVSTKGLPTEEVSTKGLPTEEVSTKGLPTEEVSTKGLPAENVLTKVLGTEQLSTVQPKTFLWITTQLSPLYINITTNSTENVKTTTEPVMNLAENVTITSLQNQNTTDYTLDDISLNNTSINETKTLEEMFEEQQKHSNGSDSLFNEITTELNGQSNSTVVTEIVPAGPGIPIFNEPPEFKIHDPDEGPLDPYLHPSNDSDDSFPSTETPDQQFVLMNRPDFEPEKGSLEEKYKHLLIDADDDIPLPPDPYVEPKIEKSSNGSQNTSTTTTSTTTTSTTLSPSLWQPIQAPVIPYPYPYPYGYNPYLGRYQPYWPPFYGSGYPSPYLPQYPGYQSNQYLGNDNYQTEDNSNTEEIETTTTQKSLLLNNKLLPKSYKKFGAYITQVTLDEKQNKEVANGDEGTLEVLGPIEWVTTTTPSPNSTLSNEIRFLINQQNVNQMTRNNRRKKPILEKHEKVSAESLNNLVHSYTGPPLDIFTRTTVAPIQRELSSEFGQRRVSHRRRKLPRNRRRRIKVHRFVKIQNSTDYSLNRDNSYEVRGNARVPILRRRQHKNLVKQKRIQTQRHKLKERLNTNQEIDAKNRSLENKPINNRKGFALKTDSEPEWKTTTKPKFVKVAKIKDLKQLKVDSLTGIKWWHLEQPGYCSEPIYILSDCSKRIVKKRWSFNPTNKKCYLYEDYCSEFKANSFETSKDCFRKCYRIKE